MRDDGYDTVGVPSSPVFVYVGSRPPRVRRYLLIDGRQEWEKLCPGCGNWKPETEYWSERTRKTRVYCKLCCKVGPVRDLE